MLDYDLHCHSSVSDGILTPTLVVERAALRDVKVLALTDHDDVSGLEEAAGAAGRLGIELVNGVEVSVSWRTHTVHIVGLHIDPKNPVLAEGLRGIRSGRRHRAELMAESLARSGIGGVLEGALRYASNPDMIGRTHFARYMVEAGHCKDVRSVFSRYLVKGKPGYVSHEWANLLDAISWIRASGGVAVLAHPGRYTAGRKPMGKTTLLELLQEFVDAGGQAIEVVSGSHTPPQYAEFARYAKEFGLLSSCGSDFHGPEESYRDIGRLPDFPLELRSGMDSLGNNPSQPPLVRGGAGEVMAQFFSIHPDNPQPRLIKQAAELLREGAVIVYPTDSGFALGCRLEDKDAVTRIRQIRGLDEKHLMTLMCRDLSELAKYARVDNAQFRLLKNNTPGSYTFILDATREVPRRLQHPKRSTVGLRIPDHAVALALLEELGEPILTSTLILPEANQPLTDVDEIREHLERLVELVIEGGSVGMEPTTVIDLTQAMPVLLRRGKGPVAHLGIEE